MSVLITVPMIPPSGNALRRRFRSPFEYKRLREGWQHTIWAMIQGRDKRWLEETAKAGTKMFAGITIYHRKAYDMDNAHAGIKPILDSFVRLGYLAGDDHDHLQVQIEQVKSVQGQTTINIRAFETMEEK
jgi:hypothetical protein